MWSVLRTLSRWGPGLTAKSLSVVGRYQKFGSNPNLEGTPGASGSALLGNTNASNDALPVLYTTAAAVAFVADAPGVGVGAKYDTTISSGVWYTVGGTYRRDTSIATYGGTWTVYLDGILRGSNNYVIGGTFGGTFGDVSPQIFSHNTNAADKRCDYLYVWSRAITPQEVAWVTDQPFDMFVPRRAWSFGADVAAAADANPQCWAQYRARRAA